MVTLRLGGWLLTIGGIVALVGASTPPYKQWYSPVEVALQTIATHPTGWRIINGCFLVGTVLAALGFAAIAFGWRGRPAGMWATAGVVAFAAGTVFWALTLIFRLTDQAAAAREFLATGIIPSTFAPLQHAASRHFAGFALFAFGGVAAFGWSVLGAALAPRWVGWTMVSVGIVGIPIVAFVGPWILYVPIVALGFTLISQ